MTSLKQTNWFRCLMIATSIAFTISCSEGPTVFFQIVDGKGEPIEGAEVSAGFTTGGGWTGTPPTTHPQKGLSDQNGLFTYSAREVRTKPIFASVNKKGYYLTTFAEQKISQTADKDRPIKLTLRRVVNPVPMYARNTKFSKIEIPVVNEKVGFDLLEFDWVAPYGEGNRSDFVFYLEREFESWKNYRGFLTISFSNHGDGIQEVFEEMMFGSDLKLSRLAPTDGYTENIELKIGNSKETGSFNTFNKNSGYYFRIRSAQEESGTQRSMYGKILGGIGLDLINSETAIMLFKYYVNPDQTRNLEFDPKQNLFKNLSSLEKVKIK